MPDSRPPLEPEAGADLGAVPVAEPSEHDPRTGFMHVEAPQMEPGDLMVHLRRNGVIVHHVTRLPPSPGREHFVVFLEAALGQHQAARTSALEIQPVVSVAFSVRSPALMFVTTLVGRPFGRQL